ncbi:MAG: hypothetical protein JNN07_14550 [Verrucomicrobiales bacterium]|nr:hypothetical protein [Verrucomicrobiales bacterium]
MGSWLLLWPFLEAATPDSGVLYLTGFEQAAVPPFVLGNLHGQSGWRVLAGDAEVVQPAVGRGTQSVSARQAEVELGIRAAAPVVWVDFLVSGGGSDWPPMIPSGPASVVLVLGSQRGVLALDGDGEGNGIFLPATQGYSLAGEDPRRVSIRIDYENRRYDVWLDGVRRLGGLGFKDRAISSLEFCRWLSGLPASLDDFSVTLWGLDRDGDTDGLTDLDEVKFHGTRVDNSDTDGDGVSDGTEVQVGSDPRWAGDGWGLMIEALDSTHHRIRFPTLPGRSYYLESRPAVVGFEPWLKVAGVSPTRGDGGAGFFILPNGHHPVFYRVIAEP